MAGRAKGPSSRDIFSNVVVILILFVYICFASSIGVWYYLTFVKPTECQKGKINGHKGSFGYCKTLDNIRIDEVELRGKSFSSENPVVSDIGVVELYTKTAEKQFIINHNDENKCKMIRVKTKKDGNNCDYEVSDAGYSFGKCENATDIKNAWKKKTSVSLAVSNDEDGYGIEMTKYSKFCK